MLLDRSPLGVLLHPARLAFLRHAASVRPEPGSNSPSDFSGRAYLAPLEVRLFRRTSKEYHSTALLFSDALLAVQFSRTTGLAGPARSPADKPYSTSPRATLSTPSLSGPSRGAASPRTREILTSRLPWEEGRASPGYCRNSSGASLNARAL